MSQQFNVAVLGATGAVGETILEVLQERKFPVGEIFLLASERSAGKTYRFNGKSVVVQNVEEFDWSQAHIGLFSAGGELSENGRRLQQTLALLLSIIRHTSATTTMFRWWCQK